MIILKICVLLGDKLSELTINLMRALEPIKIFIQMNGIKCHLWWRTYVNNYYKKR
jgi:hypothetical protein